MYSFFYPSSICIVGASSKEKSIGYELLKSIKIYGYTGKVYPINPNADEVFGFKCFSSLHEISGTIDLAIVVVPKKTIEETIDAVLSKGIKSIILITAGFKETGKDGEIFEQSLVQKIKKAGARVVGPNCMGVINTFKDIMLNATFVAEKPGNGRTGFFSQSGALGAAVLNSLRETDIKFGHFISAGNKADVNENDLLKFWNEDKNISSLSFYLESFIDGEKFLMPFIKNEIKKPVIILKAGRTESGMKAASSHTGALGNNDRVVDAVMEQFGIIRAAAIEDLFNTIKGFESFPIPGGNKIAIVTNAGGPAILAVDALDKKGLKLGELSASIKQKLKELVHPEGSLNNPVDLLPGGTEEQYKAVNEIILQDENVDAVISIFVEPVMVNAFPVVEGINKIESSKPLFQVVMPLPEFWNEYRLKSECRKPLFRKPEDPAGVISNLLFYQRNKRNYLSSRKDDLSFKAEEGFIEQDEIENLCSKYDLPLVKQMLLNINEVEEQENKNEYPIVIKGISKDAVHKSELNAVKLNIKNKEELFFSLDELKSSFAEKNINLEKILVQPFINIKHEILLGGFRDNSFGPVIMFGTGGKYVEVYNDTALKSAYISDDDIEDLFDKTKIGKILKGVRGEAPADIIHLIKLIKNSAQMMLDNPQILEFDFNPLAVTQQNKIFIVDARVRLG